MDRKEVNELREAASGGTEKIVNNLKVEGLHIDAWFLLAIPLAVVLWWLFAMDGLDGVPGWVRGMLG